MNGRASARMLVGSCVAAMLLGGCGAIVQPSLPPIGSPGGKLHVASGFNEQIELTSRMSQGVYRYESPNRVTMVLYEGPAEAPREAAVIRMFWRPRFAATPVDRTATNATVRWIRFTDAADDPSLVAVDDGFDSDAAQDTRPAEARGEAAVYSGAGFVFVHTDPGRGRVGAALRDATVRLTDLSPGFVDRIGEASVTGKLIVKRDDAAVNRLLHRIEAMLDRRLGYPRLVHESLRFDATPCRRAAAFAAAMN